MLFAAGLRLRLRFIFLDSLRKGDLFRRCIVMSAGCRRDYLFLGYLYLLGVSEEFVSYGDLVI